MSDFDEFQINYMKEVEHLCTRILSVSLLTSAEQNFILVYFDSALAVLRSCADYVSFICDSRDSKK